jgi:pimeloyl-ACP methyl ester carboxylesterase
MSLDAKTPADAMLKRPDGAEIHWHSEGVGPAVLVTHHTLWSYPGVYARLIAELARDHEVVTYDPRGCGQSSRRGPYRVEVDAADLLAVTEAASGGLVAVAVGDGFNRVARVAAERPDLISEVIAIGPAAAAFLPRGELEGSEVPAASRAVIDMVLQLMSTDPRAALRTMIAATNPDLGESDVRDRLEKVAGYLDLDATSERAQAWLADDVSEQARALGRRLWIFHGGTDPMFEGALAARVADLYPEAHVEELENGPISRPDITAERVRRLTRARSR